MESLSNWTTSELRPALSAVGGITVHALDTVSVSKRARTSADGRSYPYLSLW